MTATRSFDLIGPDTDREAVIQDLAAARPGESLAGRLVFARQRLSLAFRLADGGHIAEWDPPAALTITERWTCTRCGDAALQRTVMDEPYGTALDCWCPDAPGERWVTCSHREGDIVRLFTCWARATGPDGAAAASAAYAAGWVPSGTGWLCPDHKPEEGNR